MRAARDAEKGRSPSRLPQMKKKTIRIMLTTSKGNQNTEMAQDNLSLSLFSAIHRKIKVGILLFLILAVKVMVSAQIQKNVTQTRMTTHIQINVTKTSTHIHKNVTQTRTTQTSTHIQKNVTQTSAQIKKNVTQRSAQI
jgi:hypothetical protein